MDGVLGVTGTGPNAWGVVFVISLCLTPLAGKVEVRLGQEARIQDARIQNGEREVHKTQVMTDDCMTQLKNHIFLPQNISSPHWDASGKPAGGLSTGNLVWLGRYEDCQALHDGKYCLVDLNTKVDTLASATQFNMTSAPIRWGICAFSSCNNSILQDNIQNIFEGALGLAKAVVEVGAVNCAESAEVSHGYHATLGIIFLMVALCIIGSMYDLYQRHLVATHPKLVHRIDTQGSHLVATAETTEDPQGLVTAEDSRTSSLPEWERPPDPRRISKAFKTQAGWFTRFWQCFSAAFFFENLFSSGVKVQSRNIACLDCLRVLSMAWIILGHTFLATFNSGFVDNPLYTESYIKSFPWQFVGNAFFAVDTFFLLSGVLVAYLGLPLMEKAEGKLPLARFYFHRYLRLTPVVGVSMLLWMFVVPHLGSGPQWFNMVSDAKCSDYWWSNLLYIQNLYPVSLENVCIGWVWYLAVDMQFYLLSPLLLHTLFRYVKAGMAIVTVLGVTSLTVTAVLIASYHIDINLTANVLQGNHIEMERYESLVYGKPYCRITPYLVGLLLGYVLYKERGIKRRLPLVAVWGGLIASVGTGVGLIWGLYHTSWHGPLSLAESVVYGSLSHLLWALALAWLIYTCNHGYTGPIRSVLEWRWWRPLSRLTYCVYMVHPIAMFLYFKSLKAPIHVTNYSMGLLYLGFLVLSYIGAVVMSLLIETPVSNLENYFLGSHNKEK